ncbi:hypothetical protein E2562_000740 [Oryza meyeriana var. granulata]|uniref:Uncharacterized protein n=1 Tax=Oryza meyeriana var. granulata TaxID=110450 RepID=A0A6G1DUE1_9ORYZ|nr:hypothetical protein E2562_000740 [Oryza meyeriana var. granulata]
MRQKEEAERRGGEGDRAAATQAEQEIGSRRGGGEDGKKEAAVGIRLARHRRRAYLDGATARVEAPPPAAQHVCKSGEEGRLEMEDGRRRWTAAGHQQAAARLLDLGLAGLGIYEVVCSRGGVDGGGGKEEAT